MSNAFSLVGSLAQARKSHTATLLNDGRVLIAARRKGGTESLTAELFDPSSSLFTYTGSLSMKRKRHRATLLGDGTVLVSGGAILQNAQTGAERFTSSAELFDPSAGAFRSVGSMHQIRGEHESTLLSDGTALITGGNFDPGPEDVYQPTTQSFSAVGQMVQTRIRHTTLLLSNPAWGALYGKAVVIGGAVQSNPAFGGIQQALDSTELYDPASGQFSSFATMTVARKNHTATLLSDGRILVTGGVGRPFISATAEILTP